jgi:hypothetical protein
MYGLVKKVVIADNLAIVANSVFAAPGDHSGFALLAGVYAFAMQIYCDFSGYTDMARGIGFVLGYDVGVNFRFPYFAIGVRDFWSRWHISLSTWLRDYLYIPLGGNRAARPRWMANIMTTMLLGGLWHGANWTFVVWGAIHGVWIVVEHEFVRWRKASGRVAARSRFAMVAKAVLTFHMVCITWVFFRADSVADAVMFFTGITRSTRSRCSSSAGSCTGRACRTWRSGTGSCSGCSCGRPRRSRSASGDSRGMTLSTSSSESRGSPPTWTTRGLRRLAKESVLSLVALLLTAAACELLFLATDNFGLVTRTMAAEMSAAAGEDIYVGRAWRRFEMAVPRKLNVEGYNWDEFDAVPNRPLRVLVMGDSYVEAFQVPRREHFATRAMHEVPGVQLVCVGRGGYYLPLQWATFRDDVPTLFGTDEKYPPIDAVLFCVRRHGIVRIAHGRNTYDIAKPPQPWQYLAKRDVTTWIRHKRGAVLKLGLPGYSFLADRTGDWLSLDLDRSGITVDDAALDRAEQTLAAEVIAPLARRCEESGLPFAFMYIPTINEVERPDSKVAPAGARVLRLLREGGHDVVSAHSDLRGRPDAFFESDHHLNAEGHRLLSTTAVRALQNHILPRLER